MLYDEIKGFFQENPGSGGDKLHKTLDISRSKARRIAELHRSGKFTPESVNKILPNSATGTTVSNDQPVRGFRNAINAEQFRKQFDLPSKLKKALDSLKDQVILDSDFRTELGIAATSWKIVASRPEFSENKLEIKGKIYWGQRAVLAKIKKTIDIL